MNLFFNWMKYLIKWLNCVNNKYKIKINGQIIINKIKKHIELINLINI